MPQVATLAGACIAAEIRARGPMTFARFMEIVLYGEHGYYTNLPDPRTDYATSPQMHTAFGAMIAKWLLIAWQALDEPDTFDVVEIGAGDGRLSQGILDTLSANSETADDAAIRFERAIRYRALDIRPRGIASDIAELRDSAPIVGCVISNELLDAFPAHRFQKSNGELLESYVDMDADDGFKFVEREVSTSRITERVGDVLSTLPDGYVGEVNLGIDEWASDVGKLVEHGYVLTIDYGHGRDLLYHPERVGGSLRCYRDHVLGQNPFRDIGLQDLTTHVDFTAVDDALARVGFAEMMPLQSQRKFLFDLGIEELMRQLRIILSKSRTDSEIQTLSSELQALNSLVDLRGLGSFKVTQHGKGAPSFSLPYD